MSRAAMWTEAFERLHEATTTDATIEEVERLEAAEQAELIAAEDEAARAGEVRSRG
jgi:hypothetical protein